MGTRSWTLAAASGILLLGVIAGCAKAANTATGPSASAAPTGVTSTSAPSPSAVSSAGEVNPSATAAQPDTDPTGGVSVPPGVDITVTGNLEDGVEPNCTLLRTPSTLYLLLGDTTDLRSHLGTRATVTGHTLARPMATTCQQGTPFFVTSARAGV